MYCVRQPPPFVKGRGRLAPRAGRMPATLGWRKPGPRGRWSGADPGRDV